MPILIECAIEAGDWAQLPELETLANRALFAVIEKTQSDLPENCEISLLFCDDPFIQSLNKQWRGTDKPTNVLAFPSGGDLSLSLLLGDIVISFDTANVEAQVEGKSLAGHVSHLLVHGCLHLLGYDHMDDAEAEEMERLERDILNELGISDPYRTGLAEAAG